MGPPVNMSVSQELNEERTSFEREVLSKNEKIADLKERLQEKKSETAIELRYLAKESKGTCLSCCMM